MFENLTLFQVIIVGTLMFFALTAIIIAVISMYNKKLVTEKLAHKDALVKSEIVGLEKERERLAKDLDRSLPSLGADDVAARAKPPAQLPHHRRDVVAATIGPQNP